jgi:outer membrane protein assembly factor BamB
LEVNAVLPSWAHPLRLAAAGLLLTTSLTAAESWSRFRGPNGSGIGEGGGYPAALDPVGNARWKAAARPGKSSPVLSDKHVFLTAFDDQNLFTQCFDRATGKLLWERAVPRERQADMNQLNEPAAISPVTDGESVFVLFRDAGLLSYDAAGELRWRMHLGSFANSMGHSSSPILAEDKLILQADQKHDSYIAAVDPRDGELLWTTARQEGEGWATPILISGGRVATVSRGWLGAHRIADGKRTFELQALSPAIVASPAVYGDTLYTFGYGNESVASFERGFATRDKDGNGELTIEEIGTNPFMVGVAKYDGNRDGLLTREEYLASASATVAPSRLFAFRFDASGSARELWRYERSFNGVIPSPLVYQGVLYLVKNGGILETLDAETGEVLHRGRLRDAIGGYSASPVAAGGLVYFASEDGVVTVLEAGREWQVAATSDLGEPIFATPALSGGEVFLRAGASLYCFRNATD